MGINMSFFKGCLILIITLGITQHICGQNLHNIEDNFIKIIEKSRKSVVRVRIFYKNKRNSANSGIVIDSRGHIVTLASVMNGHQKIVILGNDGKNYKASLIGVDAQTNIAVLRVKAKKLFKVGKSYSENLRPGSWLIIIGNPYGLKDSASVGIVSGLKRCVQLGGFPRPLPGLIQTTAPINPGDGGGLVVDSRGRFVGMVFSTLKRASVVNKILAHLKKLKLGKMPNKNFKHDVQKLIKYMQKHKKMNSFIAMNAMNTMATGINFILPSDTILWVSRQIIAKGKVERGWVGMKVKDCNSGQGVIITDILPQSPAFKSGLQKNDKIVLFNNRKIENSHFLLHHITHLLKNQKIKLVILRGEKRFVKLLTLEQLPQ